MENNIKNHKNIELTPESSRALADTIIGVLDEKKAHEIKLLHVENKTIIADYFIICSGTSNTQIKSLANEVEFKLQESGINPSHIEGADEASWILLDYSSVIVHIFNRETRNFYNLEKLWKDSEEIDISHITDNI
ncbi:MAG: ribosome silencing factor [Eubacteriales bacterium]|nr:ribosome silencing factor [Eubacteriales bacterium]